MDSLNVTTKILLALACVEELSYRKKADLIEKVGDPSTLTGKRAVLCEILGETNTNRFFENYKDIDKTIENLKTREIHWLTVLDDDYPDELRQIDGAPLVLFLKGDTSALRNICIGMVGARRPTRYGEKVANEFAREFSRAGLTIVSGFARGIDSISHKACVAEGNPTIAVFACGLDVCYPAEHKGLGESILQKGGLFVSEYPLGTKPLQYHFPERNRIISGLSRAVFLAEAAKQSGSLITMKLALEQGKDIFVVPGNIYSAESEGSNELLREMPHALVISPQDVLDTMGVKREVSKKQVVELDIIETQIVDALHDCEKHFEDLLEVTSISVADLTSALFNLELKGVIQNLGGNYYGLA